MQTQAAITRNHTHHRCGPSHPKARLTTEQVAEIRALYARGGLGYGLLGEIFNCGASTIRDIVQLLTRWNG